MSHKLTVRTATPDLGDPVVVDGVKYRIGGLSADVARLRASYGGRSAVVDPRELDWDQRAGVWRADRCIRTH